jgi:hypothetical protein
MLLPRTITLFEVYDILLSIPKAWDQNEKALYEREEPPHVSKEAPHVAKVPLFWRKVPSISAQYLRRRAQLLKFEEMLTH